MDYELAKKRMRKCKDILTTTGYGIVILVLWDFLKGIIYLNWSIPTITESLNHPYAIAYTVFIFTELAFCTASGIFFLKIGRGSKEIGVKTLTFAILLLLYAIACIAINIATIILSSGFDIMTSVIFVEDILFLFFSTRILYSVITLVKLSKALKEQNNER